MNDCIFCQIVSKKIKSYIFWEDEKHMAFLSLYPNTEGATVVVTKVHYSSYAFDLADDTLASLINAAKKVGKILDMSFENVGRTALILEGFGINHVHAKLYPLHGTGNMKEWRPIKSNIDKYYLNYEGYVSSHDSQEADHEKLGLLAQKLRKFVETTDTPTELK